MQDLAQSVELSHDVPGLWDQTSLRDLELDFSPFQPVPHDLYITKAVVCVILSMDGIVHTKDPLQLIEKE